MIFLRKIILYEFACKFVAMNLRSRFILNFLYLKNGKKIPEKGSKEGG